jgi:hypothetical protein
MGERYDLIVERCYLKITAKSSGSSKRLGYRLHFPVHEALLAEIRKSPGHAFTSSGFPFYRDGSPCFRTAQNPDEVARTNGWRFHTDGVYLNNRGGMIAARLIEEFLDR